MGCRTPRRLEGPIRPRALGQILDGADEIHLPGVHHFICPECNARHDIFGSGGAKRKAAELNVPFLGEVPLNIAMRILGDEGKVGSSFDDEASRPYLDAIGLNLVKNLVSKHRQKPAMPSLSVLK